MQGVPDHITLGSLLQRQPAGAFIGFVFALLLCDFEHAYVGQLREGVVVKFIGQALAQPRLCLPSPPENCYVAQRTADFTWHVRRIYTLGAVTA